MIANIYNSDCMEAMSKMKENQYDLAICDPEYQNNDAIGIKNSNKHKANRKDYKLFKNIKPCAEYFNILFKVSKKYIIWGGNYFGLSGGVIVWNKFGTAFGECEISICNTHNSVRIFNYRWNGMLQENMKNKEIRIHPTQKPVQLYKYCLSKFAKKGDKILDTHGGSMSIVIACIDLGFDIDIYEIDKDYFNDAKKRILNYVSQLNLFNDKPVINFHE